MGDATSTEALDLDAIRARAEAATPGPWEKPGSIHHLIRQAPPRSLQLHHDALTNGPQMKSDAEFIAHARSDVPALIAEVERLRGLLALGGVPEDAEYGPASGNIFLPPASLGGDADARTVGIGVFRKRPIEVEAWQWDGSSPSLAMIEAWSNRIVEYTDEDGVLCHTLEGPVTVTEGDWIIKGVEGEFYPCKPSIFEATYEPVPDDAVADAIFDSPSPHPEPEG